MFVFLLPSSLWLPCRMDAFVTLCHCLCSAPHFWARIGLFQVYSQWFETKAPACRSCCRSLLFAVFFCSEESQVEGTDLRKVSAPGRLLYRGYLMGWIHGCSELWKWEYRLSCLPAAALWGACGISANSPSVLIKPQVTDNCRAHLLWPI